jgi:ankyrin repeat protein
VINFFHFEILDTKNATPLHFAARFNAIDCVRLFIEHRVIIDRQDASGNTPLHSIALCRQIIFNNIEENDILQNTTAHFLLHTAKKSNLQFYLEIKNKDKKTALSVACEHGNIHLVKILLLYGANINDYMPIHMAVKSGNIKIVQLLLEHHVKLTLTNIYRETPLHIACKYNRTDILQILITRYNDNEDLEVRDCQGYTPLLTASYFNHRDCIRLLLNNGADITAIDNYDKNICKYDLIGNRISFGFVLKYIFALNDIVKMLCKVVSNGSEKMLVVITCLSKVIVMGILYFTQVFVIHMKTPAVVSVISG